MQSLSRSARWRGSPPSGCPLPPANCSPQAAAGPVVTFNVSAYRSDALLLTEDGITSLELPGLSYDTLIEQINVVPPGPADRGRTWRERIRPR